VSVFGFMGKRPVWKNVNEHPAGSYSERMPVSPVAKYMVGSPQALMPTSLSFPTASPTATLFIEAPNTGTPFGVIPVDSQDQLTAFIHAPSGVLSEPYVILTAFGRFTGTGLQIKGSINIIEFVCTGSPCRVPLTGDSIVTFKAYSPLGEMSNEVQARVRIKVDKNGYLVTIDSINQLTFYQDACAGIWGIKDTAEQSWAQFPQSPYELNTDKTLHVLASHLITTGIVDAGDCEGGGLIAGTKTPTGCGIQRAGSKMIEWQNQFDFSIWSASLKVGIPPLLLKTIIEYETQYWPANQRFFIDEIGLGQINQLGIDVLLRQDPVLYQQICPKVLSNCNVPYTVLDADTQALIRGAALNSIDADCLECVYGLDLEKANQSIPLIAQLVRANCELVNRLVLPKNTSITYNDLWKFTLVSYHSGIGCLQKAFAITKEAGQVIDWQHISENLNCKGSQNYVDGFWGSLLSFDMYRLDQDSTFFTQTTSIFVPTQTPIPPPTAIPAYAQIWVRVFMDANGNGLPEKSEWLNGLTVEMLLRNNKKLTEITSNGEAIFDMSGYPLGMDVIVSLPGFYREQLVTLPADGIIQIDFIFLPPEFPNQLP
jgi:hypothetical protein